MAINNVEHPLPSYTREENKMKTVLYLEHGPVCSYKPCLGGSSFMTTRSLSSIHPGMVLSARHSSGWVLLRGPFLVMEHDVVIVWFFIQLSVVYLLPINYARKPVEKYVIEDGLKLLHNSYCSLFNILPPDQELSS